MHNAHQADESSITALFGCNSFSNAVMREWLPSTTYKELQSVQAGRRELTLDVADVVADAMKAWAIQKGATHYTHWFHPLTGLTAEKHESFISTSGEGTILMEFSGKELIKGEPDASSFPSGGLRATFEARGYTAWDVTSPAFLKQDPTGTTLCIPTAFFSYHGHALDKKVPLLRSMDALGRQALRVVKALGHEGSDRVLTTVGPEQEYFLVDKAYYDRRPDLLLTGRTVFGSMPAKGQEMEDHYYGAIDERVSAFMRELNRELWRVGVAAKTQHNEVAPNQFELAPIFSTTNVAVDSNQLVMETIRKVARRHGMEALLHEKPFAGVNGSGKHNNWSLATNDGINLLEPGEDPASNARFLLFLTAIIEAVDRYALLLRASAAVSGNDHRLGASEAPPAIISVYLGDQLCALLDDVVDGKARAAKGAHRIELGVTSLPSLPIDISDRNRTSPLAFTGNKFEFRMVGSSQSIATPNTYLNTAVAQVLSEYADRLEASGDRIAAIRDIIRDSFPAHRRVVFNGNGYAEEWVKEAERRGLPNARDCVDALPVLARPETIELFERHRVMSRAEAESRYHIYLEKYSKQINIEAGVAVDMSRRLLFPAIASHAAALARDAASLAAIGAPSAPLERRSRRLAELAAELYEETERLDRALSEAQAVEEGLGQARAYRDRVTPLMATVRSKADAAERLVERGAWPIPTYEDLLFRL